MVKIAKVHRIITNISIKINGLNLTLQKKYYTNGKFPFWSPIASQSWSNMTALYSFIRVHNNTKVPLLFRTKVKLQTVYLSNK